MSSVKQNRDDKYLLIGKVTKPHGLRGDVKIYCFSGQPENLAEYQRLTLRDDKGRLAGEVGVANARVQGKTAVVKFVGVDSRNQAEAIEGHEVLLAKEDIPQSKPGEFYWHQYTGKQIVEGDGSVVGTVRTIFHSGAQDILVVDTGKGEVMIPVTKTIILEVRDDELIVDLPPGLLDINSDTSE